MNPFSWFAKRRRKKEAKEMAKFRARSTTYSAPSPASPVRYQSVSDDLVDVALDVAAAVAISSLFSDDSGSGFGGDYSGDGAAVFPVAALQGNGIRKCRSKAKTT